MQTGASNAIEMRLCARCDGTGYVPADVTGRPSEDGAFKVICFECNGSGKERTPASKRAERIISGFFRVFLYASIICGLTGALLSPFFPSIRHWIFDPIPETIDNPKALAQILRVHLRGYDDGYEDGYNDGYHFLKYRAGDVDVGPRRNDGDYVGGYKSGYAEGYRKGRRSDHSIEYTGK